MRGHKRQSYEYHLTLLNVRMKVKFPCRMKIQHMGSLVTGQTPISSENRYIFNQEIILRDDQGQQCFQFVINLVTQMGSKYIAGVIKLYHSEMVRSEGEKLVLSLSKCIDSQAFCEIKVDQVICKSYEHSKSRQRRNSAKKSNVNYNQRQLYEIDSPKASQYQLKHVGSRTQYEYPSATTMYPPRTSFHSKSKANQKTQIYKSPNKIQGTNNQRFYEEFELRTQNQLQIEESGYKQAYLKLKQKSKKEIQKLKSEMSTKNLHQINQNALKLQLMKYKIRFQELQRSSKDKNNKLIQTGSLSLKIRQLESQNNYLNSQIKKRDNDILRLQDTIQSLTCDLQQLTESLREKKSQQVIKVKQLKLSAETLRQKLTQKEKEIQYIKLDHQELVKQKNQELGFKNVQIEHDRKLILELQKNLQAKIFQHQKILQNQRTQNKSKIQEELEKIEKLEKQILLLSSQKQQLKRKSAEFQALYTKEEYQRKLLTSECESHRSQCLTLRQFRDKYLQASKQNKTLSQRLLLLENQISRLIESKNENSIHINKQFHEQVQYFRKLSKDSEEKSKISLAKINQLENQLNQTKGEYSKMRKSLQIANEQLVQIKQREKITKKNLKQRENNSLSIQSDYATLKHKISNIDEIYKLQITKIKSQLSNANGFLQVEKTKNAQHLQKINALEVELKKNQQKLAQTQKKKEFYQSNNTQNQSLVEELKKENQIQSKELERLNELIMKKQKQQNFKLHQIQEDLKFKNEKIEKLKKDLKDVQERFIAQTYSVKNQSNEIQNLTDVRAQYEQNITEFTLKLKQLQKQVQSKKNQQSRLSNLNHHFKQQIDKLKNQLKQKSFQNQSNIKQNQELKLSLTNVKDENSQLFQKLNTFKKQFQRFKETLTALDTKYLAPIYKKQEKQANIILSQQTTFNELILALTNQFKQIKQIYSKKQQQISLQKKENQSLHQNMHKIISTAESNQNRLKNSIIQLQGQIQKAYYEKNIQVQNFTAIINQLNKKIEEKDAFQQNMHNQIQELNFNINSMKLDFQATNDQNNRKIIQLRKINSELQQRIKEKQILNEDLEERLALYVQEIAQKSNTASDLHQINKKLEKQNLQYKQLLQAERNQLQSHQKMKKQVTQKLNELQFALISEKQQNQKNKKSLQQQQKNTYKLNALISSLMKEKQLGIKRQLEGNDTITNIENKLLEKEKDLQFLQEQYQKNIFKLEEYKQTIKNLNSVNKQIESQLKKQKSQTQKLLQKISEKDATSLNRDDTLNKAFQAFEKTIQKLKRQKILLQQELQSSKNNLNDQVRSKNNKIIELERKTQAQKTQNQALQNKNLEIEQQMFEQYQKITQLQENLLDNKKTINQLKEKINELDICLNQVNQQLRIKDEKLFGLADKNYNLELKLHAQQQYRYEQLQKVSIENTGKQQALCEQYESRLQMLQTEIKGLKRQINQKNSTLEKKNLQIKRLQEHQAYLKRTNDQRLQKLEQERNLTLSSKNSQIQQLNDQVRLLNDTIKLKQNQSRKLVAQIQLLRRTITALQIKLKQYEEKYNNIIKQQRQESQSFRKKQNQFKVFKEAIVSQKWNMQRQMKKILQGYVRSFLEISDQKNTNKVIQNLRLLQVSIFQVLNNRNNEVK